MNAPVPGRSAPLNPKQIAFAHEYAKSKNGQASVIAAGYSRTGASVTAVRLLAHPRVAALVAKLTSSQLAKIDASAERIKLELSRIALADPSQMYDANGKLLSIHKMPEDVRRAISGFTEKGEPKLWDKVRANELLAKHHGLLHEVLEVVDSSGAGEVTEEEWAELSALRHVVRAKEPADG